MSNTNLQDAAFAQTATAPSAGAVEAVEPSTKNPLRSGLAAAREQAQEVSEVMNEKIADLSNAAKRTARETGEKVRDYAREQSDKAREYAREQGDKAREFAREQYEARSEQVRRGYSVAKENVSEWSDDLTDYVRENPGRSLLAAAGVGFLLGLLVRSIRRD